MEEMRAQCDSYALLWRQVSPVSVCPAYRLWRPFRGDCSTELWTTREPSLPRADPWKDRNCKGKCGIVLRKGKARSQGRQKKLENADEQGRPIITEQGGQEENKRQQEWNVCKGLQTGVQEGVSGFCECLQVGRCSDHTVKEPGGSGWGWRQESWESVSPGWETTDKIFPWFVHKLTARICMMFQFMSPYL